jgi:predicted 3-demethylubiquinone-9 3-methyltransferase (glyoxalase superfamily)
MQNKITTCLWFDGQAQEAAEYYVSVFGQGSRVTGIEKYGEAGPGEPGTVMLVSFELAGSTFVGLNGGPQFPFTEAVSLQIDCEDQAEVDHYWARLTEGGGQEVQCGWLKDRYGLSWQVIPRRYYELALGSDPVTSQAVIKAMLGMKRLDVQALEDAAASARSGG